MYIKVRQKKRGNPFGFIKKECLSSYAKASADKGEQSSYAKASADKGWQCCLVKRTCPS